MANIVELTHRRMSPPHSQNHQHITYLQWKSLGTNNTGSSTTEAIVEWIDDESGIAVVKPGPNQSTVGTVNPGDGGPKYLRTYADDQWNNNLLSLPRY